MSGAIDLSKPELLPPSVSRYLASFMRVVPRYRDLFGQPATLDQLMAIVRRYPLPAWLSFLSRLQTLLGPPNETNVERHRAAFVGLMGPDVRRRLVEFEKEHHPHGSCLTFVEPQIATLQQLAILHAPDDSDADFTAPKDFDQLAIALLATWDLMEIDPSPRNPDAVTAALAQAVLRNLFEQTSVLATRAHHAYRLGDRAVPEAVAKLRTYFETATGVLLSDYALGGLTVLILEETRSHEELAVGWTPVAPSTPQKDPLVGDPVEAFCRVRCAGLDQLKGEIRRYDGQRPIHEFSLIALSRYPLVEVPGQGRFILSTARVADALFEGVRHAIQTAALDGIPGIPALAEIGKAFGLVFEEYVHEILRLAFRERLVRLPRSDLRKRADGLVLYADRVVVYEVKSKHPPAATRRGPRTIQERETELRAIGVDEAAEQLAATITELRQGALDAQLGRQYDWTSTYIVPVVITAETVPLVWNIWRQFENLTRPIAELPMQDQISRPRFLDISDVERLPDLAESVDIGRVLVDWANHPETFERSFFRHLGVARIDHGSRFLRTRYARAMHFLADRVGLDASKLGF